MSMKKSRKIISTKSSPIKNTLLMGVIGALFIFASTFSISSFAQNLGTRNINLKGSAILDDVSAQRNLAGSCDSTCNGEIAAPNANPVAPAATILAAPIHTFENRLVSCQSAGYSVNHQGIVTQKRNVTMYQGTLYQADPWVTQSDTCTFVAPAPPPAPPSVVIPGTYNGLLIVHAACDGDVGYQMSATVYSNGMATLTANTWIMVGAGDSSHIVPGQTSCSTSLDAAGNGYCTAPGIADNGAGFIAGLNITNSNNVSGNATIPGASCGQ